MNISILIVNYNTRNLLKQCLCSIKKYADIPSYEIIVVDNNSHDDSIKMLRSEFPDVRLIESKENLGFVGGNNLAAQYAQGKYLLLLNSDTELTTDGLRGIYDFIIHHSDAGVVGGKMLNRDGSIQYSCRKFPTIVSEFLNQTIGRIKYFNPFDRKTKMMDFDHNSIKPVDWVSGAYMMIPKSIVDKIRLFDPKIFMFFEDTDLCRKITNKGYKIYFFPNSIIYHFHGQSTKNNIARSTAVCFQGSIVYFRKHHSKLGTFLYKWSVLTTWFLFRIVFTIISILIPYEKFIRKRELFTQCIIEYNRLT